MISDIWRCDGREILPLMLDGSLDRAELRPPKADTLDGLDGLARPAEPRITCSTTNGTHPPRSALNRQGRVLLTLLWMWNAELSPQALAGISPGPPTTVMRSPTRAASAPVSSSTVTSPSRRTTL